MIYDILPVNNYIGNGSSTEFEFDFLIDKPSQLAVYLFDENENKHKLIQDIDYVVSGINSENGGYITFPIFSSKFDILQHNQKISLELDIPATQETDYNNSSLLNLSAVEHSFDYLTRLVQILKRKLSLCVKVEECSKNSPQDLLESINNAAIISKENADKSLNILGDIKNEIEKFNKNVQITNCITEIPQRINLELTDGVLTLKAGSVVTVPNGFEIDGQTPKFDYVTIDSDKQLIVSDPNSTSSSSGWLIFYSTDGYARNSIRTLVFSGNTAPTFNANYAVWYDTASNVIKYTSDKGVTWTTQNTALPLCSLTRTNGTATSVDIIYNSMGCFASTVWIDKGIKALIPNGRNEDGSLKNIEVISTKLTISTNPFGASDSGCARIFIMEDGLLGIGYRYIESETEPTTTYTTWYNPKTNLMFYRDATTSGWLARFMTPIFSLTYDYDSSTSINTFTNMVPKSPFRAVDYSDKPQISSWAMPSGKYIDLNLGANNTTYTAPANGYFMLSGTTTSTSRAQVALYAEDACAYGNKCVTTTNSDYIIACIPIQRGTRTKVSYTDNLTNKILRFIYAQGEV